MPHAPSASAFPSAAALPATGVRFFEELEAEKQAEAEEVWA